MPPVSNETGSKAPLAIALGILGVTAGLTATAYFVGAVTIWLRLHVSGFPADIGLELASDGRIIAVGVRGIAVVVGIVGLLLLFVRLYARYLAGSVRTLVQSSSWWYVVGVIIGAAILFPAYRVSERVFLVVDALLLAGAASMLVLSKGGNRKTQRVFALIFAVLAILISAGVGWRLFGLVVATLGISFLIALTSDGTAETGWNVPWWVASIIVGFAVLAAIAWQVNTPISIATVRVLPPMNPDLGENPALPYFGSTDDVLYVACVIEQTDPDSEQDYRYLHSIIELRRDALTYVEYSQAEALYPNIKTPADFASDWIRGLWHGSRESDVTDREPPVERGGSEPACQPPTP